VVDQLSRGFRVVADEWPGQSVANVPMFVMTDGIFDTEGLLLNQRCCGTAQVCDSDQIRVEPEVLVLVV